MNVWTNGNRTVLLGPHGLSIHDEGDARLVVHPEELGRERRRPNRWVEEFHPWRPLAVDAEATRAFLVDFDGRSLAVELESGDVTELDDSLLDIVDLPGEDGFFAVRDVDGNAVLATGEWARDEFEWSEPFDLPETVPSIDWPDLLWAESSAPWSSAKAFGTRVGDLHLSVSEFGFSVSDLETGIVAWGEVESEGGASAGALRFPAAAEDRLRAASTSDGLLVSVVADGRESALLSVERDGTVTDALSELDDEDYWTAEDIEVLDDRRALLLSTDGAQPVLSLVGLDGLDEWGRQTPVGDAHGEGSLAVGSTSDGIEVVIGTGMRAHRFRLGEEPDSHDLGEPRDLEVPDPTSPEFRDVEPIEGTPDLVPMSPRNDTLEFSASDPRFELPFEFQNRGGPGDTVVVELMGSAVATGLLQFDAAVLSGRQTDFDGRRLQVEDADLRAAVRNPQGTLEPAVPALARLIGRAQRTGDGRLMVTIRPAEGSGGDGASIARRVTVTD